MGERMNKATKLQLINEKMADIAEIDQKIEKITADMQPFLNYDIYTLSEYKGPLKRLNRKREELMEEIEKLTPKPRKRKINEIQPQLQPIQSSFVESNAPFQTQDQVPINPIVDTQNMPENDIVNEIPNDLTIDETNTNTNSLSDVNDRTEVNNNEIGGKRKKRKQRSSKKQSKKPKKKQSKKQSKKYKRKS